MRDAAMKGRFGGRTPWRIVVVYAVSAAFASACGGGGGSGGGSQTLAMNLVASTPCYGARIRLPPGIDASGCTPEPAAVAAGCTASLEGDARAAALTLRGCFLDGGTPLYSCELPPREAGEVSAAAVLSCGCGCRDDCDTRTTGLCFSGEAGNECPPPASTTVPKGTRPSRTVSRVETMTVSTTTFCGTCCDAGIEFFPTLDDAVELSELFISVQTFQGGDPCPVDDCERSIDVDGPTALRVEGTSVELCVSDSEGFVGPAVLAACSIFNGGGADFPVTVLRALDPDFLPVTPRPGVSAPGG